MDRYLRVTHPSATKAETFVRLACVKHAASVRSEPGSNSQVHLNHRTYARQHQRTRPPNLSKHRHPTRSDDQISSACVNISRYTNNTPQTKRSAKGSQNPKPNIPFHQTFALLQMSQGAPPTYPFHSRYNFQRTISQQTIMRYWIAFSTCSLQNWSGSAPPSVGNAVSMNVDLGEAASRVNRFLTVPRQLRVD
jgi:hypothetical protein